MTTKTTLHLAITGRDLLVAYVRAYLAQRDPLALLAAGIVVPLLMLALIRALPWPEHAVAVERPMSPIIMVATPTAAPRPTVETFSPAPVPAPIAVPEQLPVVEPVAPVVVFDLPAAPAELAAPTPAPEWIATVESHEAGAEKNKHVEPSDAWCSGVHLTNPECAGAP